MRKTSRILFAEQAAFMRGQLPLDARDALQRRLEYVARMPRMYPLAEDERFPGCRGFWIDPCYRVVYMVNAGGPGAYVVAILEEELDCVDAPADVDELVLDD